MRAALVSLLVLAITSQAHAHAEGFSGLRVQVLGDHVHAALTIHTRDTSAWFPPRKFPDYVPQVSRELAGMSNELIEIAYDEQPVATTHVATSSPETGLIEVALDYPPPPAGARTMRVWSKHLDRLPRGHSQLLFVIDADGQTVCEATLTTEEDSATCDLPSVTTFRPTTEVSPPQHPQHPQHPQQPAPRRISFFLLGVEHIVTGYDHLLFLAALLLVCRTFKEAAAVITFFTIAHSITLTLAALNIVRLPGRIVEPAIAASIVYVGLENIFGKHRFGWRAGITFAFGLVHGLGFAAALREVGLGTQGVGLAMPLLKFSAGLESGQLCIAAVLLRVLLTLKKRDGFDARWVPAGSILVSLIGGYWLVTRLFE